MQNSSLVVLQPIVVHDEKLAGHYLNVLRRTKSLHGAYAAVENVEVITWNTLPSVSPLEESVFLLGIPNFVVLGRDHQISKWKFEYKISLMFEYLQQKSIQIPYVLWCNARDAVLIDNPQKAVDMLIASDADMLFSSTDWFNPDCPHIKYGEQQIARGHQTHTPFLNSGVMIGKRDTVITIVHDAMQHIKKPISKIYPDCDQIIYTVLHQKYYPRLQVDYSQKLALRPALASLYLSATLPFRGIKEHWTCLLFEIAKQVFVRALNHPTEFLLFLIGRHTLGAWQFERRYRQMAILLRERSSVHTALTALRASIWFQDRLNDT